MFILTVGYGTQSGSVGIGTANPVQKLDVRGNSYISGSVGIGTSSPVYKLQVENSSGGGVSGNGTTYDFYANGPGTNYGPFTGGHEAILADDVPDDIRKGMIVSVTGKAEKRKQNGEIVISSTLPTVSLASIEDDKAVFGVFNGLAPLLADHWYKEKEGKRFAMVNALGEGRVWVSNLNGDIKVGDYITSSSIPGYGRKQNDDLLHSFTVGKAIEAVDWYKVTETVDYNGKRYKVYLIAVVYTSG